MNTPKKSTTRIDTGSAKDSATKAEVQGNVEQVEAKAEAPEGDDAPAPRKRDKPPVGSEFSKPFTTEGTSVIDSSGQTVCRVALEHLDAARREEIAGWLADALSA